MLANIAFQKIKTAAFEITKVGFYLLADALEEVTTTPALLLCWGESGYWKLLRGVDRIVDSVWKLLRGVTD